MYPKVTVICTPLRTFNYTVLQYKFDEFPESIYKSGFLSSCVCFLSSVLYTRRVRLYLSTSSVGLTVVAAAG